LGDEGFDLREQRLEPFKQGAAAGVAYPESNDDRTGFGLAQALREILVLGDDDGLLRQSVSPDGRIVGIPKPDIGDVFGGVAMGR
jgi:hypothetical protein